MVEDRGNEPRLVREEHEPDETGKVPITERTNRRVTHAAPAQSSSETCADVPQSRASYESRVKSPTGTEESPRAPEWTVENAKALSGREEAAVSADVALHADIHPSCSSFFFVSSCARLTLLGLVSSGRETDDPIRSLVFPTL
ncbi:hypothetical protein PDE_06515 [Penicillium oxalicum 114-2]|uniref:Uncharacterized protein n=1 Tax=Penicillium oxalicum (strain 114-2 / CGMCC 5302) TaxID=933388 RepID=S7ZLN4_PENO1|nr:hypothetical protein PDE_06515 [Penicillium oxalicum 114-2]